MKYNSVIYILIFTLLSFGCTKNINSPVPIITNTNVSNLKVIYTSAYLKSDSVQIKINDARISQTFLSLSASGSPTPFPGGGLNTGGSNFPYYLNIDPGTTKISISVPKIGTTFDSIVRFTGTVNLEANKFYSAYITDTALITKLVLINENVTPVANGFSRYKFVNLIPNVAALDLYFGSTLVASNIAYGSASAEFTLPYQSTGLWAVRSAGAASTTTALATYSVSQTIPNVRIFSVFAKGYNTGTGTRAPTVSLIYN